MFQRDPWVNEEQVPKERLSHEEDDQLIERGGETQTHDGEKRKGTHRHSWIVVLCMERAFKDEFAVLRKKLEAAGALVLCYKLVECCLDWYSRCPRYLKRAPCVFICNIRTKHGAELLTYRKNNNRGRIILCMLILQSEDAIESQKAQTWATSVKPRLPFDVSISPAIPQAIEEIVSTIQTRQSHAQSQRTEAVEEPVHQIPCNVEQSPQQWQLSNSGTVFCKQCQAGPLDASSKFCFRCGLSLRPPPDPPPPNPEPNVCQQCHMTLDDAAKFCIRCGTRKPVRSQNGPTQNLSLGASPSWPSSVIISL